MAVLSTARLQEIYEVRNQCSTHVEAAEILGIAESTLRGHLNTIREKAKRGELGFKAVLPGFELYKTTDSIGKNGEVKGSHRSQRLAREEKFVPPEGLELTGLSAYTDGQDNIIGKWNLYRKGKTGDVSDAIEYIKTAFESYEPRAKRTVEPVLPYVNCLTLYPVPDLHIGMFCWAKEVDIDWDLKIAEEKLEDSISRLMSCSPYTETAVILGGGDQLHSDTNQNVTAKSGNPLQVDGRYSKVMEVACRIFVHTVDKAMEKHRKVEVRILIGNHDEHSSIALAYFLKAWYRDEPRVIVDVSPSLFWWRRFESVLLGATHGHMAKPEQMASIMAHRRAEDWGKTKYRFCHTFHVHHSGKTMTENGGVITEVHQTPIPQDAWNHAMGFLSGRSLCSIVYDPEMGEVARSRVIVT